MKTQDEVHPMVRAYLAELSRRRKVANQMTPDQMAKLAQYRWTKLRIMNEQLLLRLANLKHREESLWFIRASYQESKVSSYK